MRYHRYTCWLVILLLVRTTAPAFAQSQTQSSDPTPTIRLRHAPDVEHPVETPVLTGPSWETQAGRPGTLGLSDRWTAKGTFQLGTMPSVAGLGPTWRLKGGATYRTLGGIELSANMLGRRGYALPVFAVEPLANNGMAPEVGMPMLGTSPTPTIWESELRVQKTVKSRGAVDVTLIGSVFGLGGTRTPSERATTLTSRTLRFGVVLGF